MPDAFIARQPIFNPKLEAVGYELLFRGDGYVKDAASFNDAERATATVVLNSLTELDLGRIVGTKTPWINVSREFVVEGLVEAIPADVVGLEIAEEELFDDELTTALRGLKDKRYRLALDDFQARDGSESVLDLFDVIKLNTAALGHDGVREQAERLRAGSARLLADKLSTRPDHEFCVTAGCDLFQGYFFCRPAMLGTRGIAANRLALLQVVSALQNSSVEFSDIEQLVARDVALSFRLLRYVNSAFFGLRGDVRSIGQALALLGVDNVRRWATLSVLASIDDKPTELTVTALIRARFCELAGVKLGGLGSPAELFTLGLFSVIDAMMDAPMHDVVASLPLAEDVRDALAQRKGQKGQLLDCVVALEAGEPAPMPVVVSGAGELYFEALMWASSAAESLLGESSGSSAAEAGTAGASRAPMGLNGNGAQAADTAASKPPPLTVVAPSPAPVAVAAATAPDAAPDLVASGAEPSARGPVARFFERCAAFFRRRSKEAGAA
jgi:EAL and modified HD-GYP domain-containing signal transduction protein